MKKTIIITLLILSQITFAQKSGFIKYEVFNLNLSEKQKKSDIQRFAEAARKQTFTLTFNNNINSEFKLNEILKNGNEDQSFVNYIAALSFTYDFNFYTDSNSNSQFYKKFDGELIRENLKNKEWEITTESKIIDKYLCYKAIHKYKFIRDNKEKTREVIAWFCPALPFSYGPGDFNGLPGLIIELTDKYTTFLATSISISDKVIDIEIPKGKTISMEEYEQKVMSKN